MYLFPAAQISYNSAPCYPCQLQFCPLLPLSVTSLLLAAVHGVAAFLPLWTTRFLCRFATGPLSLAAALLCVAAVLLLVAAVPLVSLGLGPALLLAAAGGRLTAGGVILATFGGRVF